MPFINILLPLFKNLAAIIIGEALRDKASGKKSRTNEAVQPGKGLLQSKTFYGLVIAAVPMIARAMGYELGVGETEQLVESLVEFGGLALALYGRIRGVRRIGASA